MQVLVSLQQRGTDEKVDVVLEAAAETPFSDLVESLTVVSAELAAASSTPLSPWVDGVPVGAGTTFAESGLRDGSVIELGPPARTTEAHSGFVDVWIVGGAQSGRTHRLSLGESMIGSDSLGQVVFGEPARSSGEWVVVAVNAEGTAALRLSTPTPTPNIVLETHDLTEEFSAWAPGAQLRIGESIVTVQPVLLADAELRHSLDSGLLDFNRPPRLLPPTLTTRFKLPAPPPKPSRNPLPLLTLALPVILGVGLAIVMGTPQFLLFAMMSPVIAVGSWLTSRRNGKKSYSVQLADHEKERATMVREAEDAVFSEQQRRRLYGPDAAELFLIANTPTSRLWERRTTDPDYLQVRVGIADAESNVEIEDMSLLEHRRRSNSTIRNVPVIVSFATAGVIGIAGDGAWPRRRARWVLGQLAVLQSPRDLQLYILCAPETTPEWAWANWLPHLRPGLGQDAVALVGSTTDTLGPRVAELTQLVANRLAEVGNGIGKQTFFPDVVVVLDGARRLRAMPGVVTLLREGPKVGVYLLCLEGEEQHLPEECSAVVLERLPKTLTVRRQNAENIDDVITDEIVEHWFEHTARSLSPIRDASASQQDGLIPASAALLDVLEIDDLTTASILDRWAIGGRSTEATVGVSIDGAFAIDLVRDGPHGLVAGTTGAGKSEFLQSLVASLAVANRPDSMTFVLIDYKGGAAFSQCAELPHTVGIVTDLDSHLVERALDSLKAELTVRETLLAEVGVKDIEDYYERAANGHGGESLPRLTIVIDEFAALAKELPDFVTGLVGIAQRGRSLGIHLVLATQRPSGVISPEIRANTNLRVALRMTDGAESSDVIDTADAARISKSLPGRAFARLGHASLVPFQTARVGGKRAVTGDTATIQRPFVSRIAPAAFGLPTPRRPVVARTMTDSTDLAALVDTIVDANARLGIPRPRTPWMPPLPETLDLESIAVHTETSLSTSIPWGREDRPGSQSQPRAAIDLATFSHLYVVGAPQSGRSGALRTIAASAAQNSTLSDVHLYGIDCGNGALLSLRDLPHCGAIVQRNQNERATRLLTRLQAEALRRQELLSDGNFANITEQRSHSDGATKLPHIFLFIDRWETFVTSFGDLNGGELLETVNSLLRDGAGAGIHLIIAGDRALLTSRMSVLTDDKLILGLTDRLDYSLGGLNHKLLPKEIPAGRGFRAGSAIEVQIAHLGSDPSGRAQTEAVKALAQVVAARLDENPAGHKPFRVDELPKTLTFAESSVYIPVAPGPMWAMVGVGGDQLTALGADLGTDSPTFIVAGPSKSGRSTLLGIMARSLLKNGSELVIAAPRASPLRDLQGSPGVRAVLTGSDLTEQELAPLLEPGSGTVVLIVDDGELLSDVSAKEWLRAFLRTAADHQRGVILGGNAAELAGGFSGWQVDVKKNRRGALLSPQSNLDGDLVGVRLARSAISSQIVPGNALTHLGSGEIVTLLVPTLD